jgi:hypothetical protein
MSYYIVHFVEHCALFVETVHRFLGDVNNSVRGLVNGFLGDTFKCRIRRVHVY